MRGDVETQALESPENQALATDGGSVMDWRCPRCGRICNRLVVSAVREGDPVEHKCRCGAYSTATVSGGRLHVRRGGIRHRGG